MKKMNYKGRCEKRKVSKCDSIVRTYSKLQSSTVDSLMRLDLPAGVDIQIKL